MTDVAINTFKATRGQIKDYSAAPAVLKIYALADTYTHDETNVWADISGDVIGSPLTLTGVDWDDATDLPALIADDPTITGLTGDIGGWVIRDNTSGDLVVDATFATVTLAAADLPVTFPDGRIIEVADDTADLTALDDRVTVLENAVAVDGETTPTFVDVPDHDTKTDVVVVGGKIANHIYRWTHVSGSDDSVLALPPAADHEGERVITIASDGASDPAGIIEVKGPSFGTLNLGDLFTPLGSLDEVVDLTTATLGHAFIVKAKIGATEYDSAAVNDTFDLQASNPDQVSEIVRLLVVLAAPFVAHGAVLDGMTGMLTVTTAGYDHSPTFHSSQEAIDGVDLLDATATAGADHVIVGLAGQYGRGAADHFTSPPDSITGDAQYWFDNYYTAAAHRVLVALASDGEWVIEQGPVFPSETAVKSDVTGLTNLEQFAGKVLQVGPSSGGLALGDGDYTLGLTMASGVGTITWIPV